ncbi:MAG: hypothetical protein H6649_12320 [Caldilineae bacterium]|nr:hypothetical protein [Anaerolineae bacterium]MCB0205463.1 hypothetical protein [Anaerolineae bacterium]MCB0253205.1 hypothetical protein [Anaerolineae bacterium]MCB9154822.1 hypothetical protein [Caldilineae bacterium]
MAEQRSVATIDENRRLHLPDGVPFQEGEVVHLLWDGRVLQVARTKPKRLEDAYAKVQKEANRVLETDELTRRLAETEARRRRKFEELFGSGPKDEE